MARILVVDNYDSFVYNLVQYLAQLGADCVVRRNDEIPAEAAGDFDGVLLSPGPGTPDRAGACMDMVRYAAGRTPLLGVCLGHQAIAAAYGARIGLAAELLHGKTSEIHHSGAGVLRGLPNPFTGTRYHSLAVERSTIPREIEVTAETSDGVVMALRHRDLSLEGVQYHPESVLTDGGHKLLATWLTVCGDTQAPSRAEGLAPIVASHGVS